MDGFHAAGILGTINTIASILITIRKWYKAKKKISALVTDSLSSLKYINDLVPRLSLFVEVNGIDVRDFCAIAAKIITIEVTLLTWARIWRRKTGY